MTSLTSQKLRSEIPNNQEPKQHRFFNKIRLKFQYQHNNFIWYSCHAYSILSRYLQSFLLDIWKTNFGSVTIGKPRSPVVHYCGDASLTLRLLWGSLRGYFSNLKVLSSARWSFLPQHSVKESFPWGAVPAKISTFS